MTSLRDDVPDSFNPGEPWMEKMMAMKGKITDFHQLYVIDIKDNERPYDKSVKYASNEMADEWYEKCLIPYADSEGKMTSQEATDRWYSFFEAKQTRLAIKNWKLGFHPPEKVVDKWLELFDGPMEKLSALGMRTVRDGFSILIAAYDDWYVQEKWELCFKKDDPNEWYRQFKEHKTLFTRERSPFDMDHIREKMSALVNPANEPGPKKDSMGTTSF